MRAVFVVLLLFGAFMSVAGMNKVFSEEQNPQTFIQTIAVDPFTFDTVASLSAQEETASLYVAAPATAAASTVSPTPVPDFCMDIPVFLYHHTQPLETAGLLGHAQLTVDSNIFDEQMKYLVEKGYHFISAEELVNALYERRQLSEKTVIVTVDDGYQDNYTYAFLVAKKYKIIINFMIPTELIGKADYMTWDHLKEMVHSPYASIYNHTATHAALGYLSAEQIDRELSTSSAALKEQLGLNNSVFIYPYGSFSDLAIQKVKEHGFKGAYSTIEGKHQCLSEVMYLQRMHIGNAPMSFYGF